jgi:adenylosuccinate lyase
MGKYVHFGLTSSDVLDTATSLQIKDAFTVLAKSVTKLEKALALQAQKHAKTLCAGRTHGMHAEPTCFGLKMASFLAELKRNKERLEKAKAQFLICKLSGAVGTYSSLPESVENRVAELLELTPETIATQVVPRDRHAEVLTALAFLGSGLERLAVEFRHLQRTEVGEVYEGFSKGQKGSSAMPHKRNPISSENITGGARLLRSYMIAAFEDIALWHERDISHSSVERVILPDAFILADYLTDRMALVVENLEVHKDRMLENMSLSQGQLFSSHILVALISKAITRTEAYELVQKLSHTLKKGESLESALSKNKIIRKHLKVQDIKKIFSGDLHKKAIPKVIRRVLDGSNG